MQRFQIDNLSDADFVILSVPVDALTVLPKVLDVIGENSIVLR
jgi:prephenate dehydrogenase